MKKLDINMVNAVKNYDREELAFINSPKDIGIETETDQKIIFKSKDVPFDGHLIFQQSNIHS